MHITDFAAELRASANAIQGMVELLLVENEQWPEQRAKLQAIFEESAYLVSLMENVPSALAHADGDLEPATQVLDPFALAAEVVGDFAKGFEAKGLTLNCVAGGSVPRQILTDRALLRQVLHGLLSAALVNCHEGGVEIMVSFRRELGADRSTVLYQITDSGSGFDASELSAIVDEAGGLNQALAGQARLLTVLKVLVNALGATLRVASVRGTGTRIGLSVPCDALGGSELVCRERADSYVALTSVAAHLEGRRVLIADDLRSNQLLLASWLKKAGASVTLVGDGRQAYDVLRATAKCDRNYDLALIDTDMPVLDGFTAVARLREAGVELPIVALVDAIVQLDAEDYNAAGFDGVLSRPIAFHRLAQLLGELLPVPGRARS